MTLLQTLLRVTAFKNPLLRTLVPSVALAYGIQAAVAVPSIAAQTERYYDLSGSLTYLSLGSYLYKRIQSDEGKDSRFDSIRTSPPKFFVAFFAQATWVSLCTLPVILVNSVPRSAYATSLLGKAVSSKPYLTDILGLAIFVFGLTFEVIADRQKDAWVQAKKQKKHSEEFLTHGLWSKSRHPNYFGEATLWSGIAIAAAGLLVRQPAQAALGLSGGLGGQMLVAGMCAASPAFVSFLLLKVSGVPLSENKYDERYGDRKDYQKWKRETPMFVPKIW
ncbi:unnamed protein product [Alternaria alternata]